MLASTTLKTLWQRWLDRRLAALSMPEPLDHPCLQAMSLRELADLPLEPPPAPPPGKGLRSPSYGLSAQALGEASAC
ncbi:hypothetical protein [Labrys neptuniae]